MVRRMIALHEHRQPEMSASEAPSLTAEDQTSVISTSFASASGVAAGLPGRGPVEAPVMPAMLPVPPSNRITASHVTSTNPTFDEPFPTGQTGYGSE